MLTSILIHVIIMFVDTPGFPIFFYLARVHVDNEVVTDIIAVGKCIDAFVNFQIVFLHSTKKYLIMFFLNIFCL